MRTECIVIVGAGHAGVQAAASLREQGHRGRIELVSADNHLPYQRPPLSKRFTEPLEASTIALRPASFYEGSDIVLRLGCVVEGIDVTAQRLRGSGGRHIAYDHLILATGSRNRRLAVEGDDLDGVVSIRSLADAQRLRRDMATARRSVVIGAGYLGLEIAAALSKAGLSVRIIANRSLPLGRSATCDTAHHVARFLRARGIDIANRGAVAGFEGRAGRLSAVRFVDGSVEQADLAVVGIGATPDTDLAATAGLRVEDGILVDDRLSTSNATISAIGDCARPRNSSRIESVHSAVFQARRLASLLTGGHQPAPETPWFWSDIGDLKLRMAGLAEAGDTVLASHAANNGRVVLCFRDGVFVAAETINDNKTHIAARKILDGAMVLSIAEAGRDGFDLAGFAMKSRLAA